MKHGVRQNDVTRNLNTLAVLGGLRSQDLHADHKVDEQLKIFFATFAQT